jgi:hypothetical protein
MHNSTTFPANIAEFGIKWILWCHFVPEELLARLI